MSKIFGQLRRTILGRVRLLRLLLMNFGLVVGSGFFCGRGCFIGRKNQVRIGSDFYMGNYCHFGVDVRIGDNVLFASFVALVGGDHKIDNISVPMRRAGRDVVKAVVIEDDVWIGHGAIILHGVTVGSGAVVAAGAVVTKDVPSQAIAGGNPASIIRYRK